MANLYTSDWHFGHTNILKYCQQRATYLGMKDATDVTEMNERLVALWNSQAGPNDTVWVLGDMCMGRVDETIEYVGRLNGHKHLILGNHDKAHPGITRDPEKRARWEDRYGEFFESMFTDNVYVIDGIRCQISHFPYGGVDHTESERYNADIISKWTLPTAETPLVHGHVHDLYQTNGNMLNVGIDAWNGQMVTPEQIGGYFRSIGFES